MTFLAIALLVLALPLIGLQALYYLKEGGLLPFSMLDGLRFLNVGWAEDPTSFVWLHEMLKHTQLSPVLLFLAVLCYFLARRKKKCKTI